MHDTRKNSTGRGRYPGYDVLTKRTGPSWNEQTRRVIIRRLAIDSAPRFFTLSEFRTVGAIAGRVVPQPAARPPVPVAALIDDKLHRGVSDGYRLAGTPRDGEAWRLGLRALDAEAQAAYGGIFPGRGPRTPGMLVVSLQDGTCYH